MWSDVLQVNNVVGNMIPQLDPHVKNKHYDAFLCQLLGEMNIDK